MLFFRQTFFSLVPKADSVLEKTSCRNLSKPRQSAGEKCVLQAEGRWGAVGGAGGSHAAGALAAALPARLLCWQPRGGCCTVSHRPTCSCSVCGFLLDFSLDACDARRSYWQDKASTKSTIPPFILILFWLLCFCLLFGFVFSTSASWGPAACAVIPVNHFFSPKESIN